MKKTLLPMIVLIFLFISVLPASAKKSNDNCTYYKDPVNILKIDSETRKIKLPYAECYDPVGNTYYFDIWLFITETTRIRMIGKGVANFEDLAVGQLINYAFVPVDLLLGNATMITIYPE